MKKQVINKEVSWLSFNDRVLQEAADPRVPLFERIKFLGIFSSNLDEFFRVRVAQLQRLVPLGRKAKRFTGGYNPKKVLNLIQDRVQQQHVLFDDIYQQILRSLAQHRIFIVNERQLNDRQTAFVRAYFRREVRRKLIPLMIDQVDKFPELRDESIYLAVLLARADKSKAPQYAVIELPSTVPRFLILPQIGHDKYVIILDDVIRFNLDDVFSAFGYDDYQAYTVKLTRDAELELDDDLWRSFTKKMAKSLKQRREGNPVRLVYDADIPADLLAILKENLQINEDDTLVAGARYHNFRDFMKFPNFGIDGERYKPIRTLPHRHVPEDGRLFNAVKQRDILMHYPYQSFDYVIDFLRESAIDPDVLSIKITIYRAARDSSVMNALINAAKNGKRVVVVLELRARFDEEANIDWGNRLQDEGVKVIFGVPGLKVHSKLLMVTRQEKDRLVRYAIIGTGNYNEDTARIYSDHSLFTADRRLTGEVNKVFEFYERNYKLTTFKHLLVSPFDMRKKFVKLIQTEINSARTGRNAYILLKLNNLVDTELVQKLYEASQAGVKVRLIVRSMFALKVGLSELSENIEAYSIVDKFLEHSRIYVFCNADNPKYYLSSADLMRRNLDRRVEVTAPVYDPDIQKELQRFLDIQFADNVKSRVLNERLDNTIRDGDVGHAVRAQWDIYDYLAQLNAPGLVEHD
ncbi:polyphosphate kinase 1 [candidate division GN15 bacterium]|nr:polyphosphate kinase 1 [candidate division GN15 bacterium]